MLPRNRPALAEEYIGGGEFDAVGRKSMTIYREFFASFQTYRCI